MRFVLDRIHPLMPINWAYSCNTLDITHVSEKLQTDLITHIWPAIVTLFIVGAGSTSSWSCKRVGTAVGLAHMVSRVNEWTGFGKIPEALRVGLNRLLPTPPFVSILVVTKGKLPA